MIPAASRRFAGQPLLFLCQRKVRLAELSVFRARGRIFACQDLDEPIGSEEVRSWHYSEEPIGFKRVRL